MNFVARLEALYKTIQQRFDVTQGTPELAEAVQFRSNRNRSIHRWFPFKEGFSANLLAAAGVNTETLVCDDGIFLDPFCGCGTTLVAGDIEHRWQARRVGIEVNPFLAFVAQTKVGWRNYRPDLLAKVRKTVLAEPLNEDISPLEWPALSTLHNSEMFDGNRVSALVDVTKRLKELDDPHRDLLLLGVAAAAERVGFYRKDGRALRILRSPTELEERRHLDLAAVLDETWASFEQDLRHLETHRGIVIGDSSVLRGDGRLINFPLDVGVEPGQVALMAYSPPYLNHIDYTEVYKVELWLLQFVKDQEEMLNLRKQTLRSHGSIAVDAIDPDLDKDARRALEIAVSAVTTTGKRWHKRFSNLAFTYLADLRQTLERQYALLRPGARAICIVGNSAHGSKKHRIPIAIDLFIATIAESVGFQVERFTVARQLRRRNHLNQFLRETVLTFRKPSSQ